MASTQFHCKYVREKNKTNKKPSRNNHMTENKPLGQEKQFIIDHIYFMFLSYEWPTLETLN